MDTDDYNYDPDIPLVKAISGISTNVCSFCHRIVAKSHIVEVLYMY